jgi:hypothetical protein
LGRRDERVAGGPPDGAVVTILCTAPMA